MKTLKALLLGFVFVLSTSLCYAKDTGLHFNYFSACAYKTGITWEAFMLTNIVDNNGQPVKGVTITGLWGKDTIEICSTDNKGGCSFHYKDGKEDHVVFKVLSAEKKGYIFKDFKSSEIMIMRP